MSDRRQLGFARETARESPFAHPCWESRAVSRAEAGVIRSAAIMQVYMLPAEVTRRTRFGGTYTKIGTIQRRLAWPLRKDDTQIREAFHIFQ